MYDYARSDTHFLLNIFDNLRNELLLKSHQTSPSGSLLNSVRDLSKGEALQRYERQFYDARTGSGFNGWYGLLGRSPGHFNREQLAVFRAVHEWRDKIARQKDESINHVLSHQSVFTLAREMPTELPDLLGCCHPISAVMRKSALELIAVIQKAKAEGSSGPEEKDLMKLPGLTQVRYGAALPANISPSVNSTSASNRAVSVCGITQNNFLASLPRSCFWGSTISRDSGREGIRAGSKHAEEPCLALPLPPLTAEVFEVQGPAGSPEPIKTLNDPGTRAEHQYTKKRKPRADDVFIIRETGDSKKQKMSGPQEGPELVAVGNVAPSETWPLDGDAEEMKVSLRDAEDDQEAQERAKRKRERKLQKQMEKQRRKDDELKQSAGGGSGRVKDEELEAFDYENAPSVLHARQETGRAGKASKGFDPYIKSLNAPKGMRKAQKEGPGRSMTYKS